MPRGKPARGHSKLSPEEQAARMLDGLDPPEAKELFRIIHLVNPSNRAMPKREQDRLYAIKSALQSLLIREQGDSIEVEPVTGRPDVVSLRHRFSSSDACHARISSLEAPARYWVQSQLAMR